MDLIAIIRKDKELHEKIRQFCSFDLYSKEQLPDDMDGAMEFNIGGMAFAREGSGGEYILLDDNTIGFSGSEGECGRISENITELFELLLNIAHWKDYCNNDIYENDKKINEYIIKTEKLYVDLFDKNEYHKIQKELSEKLSVKIYENKIEILKRFYKTANKEPKYFFIYTEEGYDDEPETKIKTEGSLIWIKQK